jgi:hypothetical protein
MVKVHDVRVRVIVHHYYLHIVSFRYAMYGALKQLRAVLMRDKDGKNSSHYYR